MAKTKQETKNWWAEMREENAARVNAMRAGEKTYTSPKLQRESAERDKNDIFDDSALVPTAPTRDTRFREEDTEIDIPAAVSSYRKKLVQARAKRIRSGGVSVSWQRQSSQKNKRLVSLYRSGLSQGLTTGAAASFASKGVAGVVFPAGRVPAGFTEPFIQNLTKKSNVAGLEYGFEPKRLPVVIRPGEEKFISKSGVLNYDKLIETRAVQKESREYKARFKSVADAKADAVAGDIAREKDRNIRLNQAEIKRKEDLASLYNPVSKTGFTPGSKVVGFSVLGEPGIARGAPFKPIDKINITGAYVSPGSTGVQGFILDKPTYQKELTNVEIARQKTDKSIEIAMGQFDFGTSTGSALFEAQKKRPDKVKEPKKTAITSAFEGADKWLSRKLKERRGVFPYDPITTTGLAIAKGAVDVGATGVNLAALGGSQLTKLITGKDPGYQQIRLTETSPVSSGIGAGVDSLLSGGGFSSFQAAKDAFVSKAHEMGRGATFGDVFFYAAPLATLPKPVAIATIGKSKVLVGKIGGTVIPIATKTGKKIKPGFNISGIGKGDFTKIAQTMQKKAKSGVELDSLGIPTVKLITSDKGLSKFLKAGVINKDQFEFVQAGRIAIEKSRRLPQKTFRDKFPDQPFSEVKAGKETKTVLEFFRKKKIQLEGSSIDMFANIKRYQTQAGDFDVKFAKEAVAKQRATELTSELNKLGGRQFSSSGGKISVEKLDGAISKKTKIGEFLDPESAARTGQLSTSKTVMGFKISKKGFKKEDIKFRGGRFQTQRMIASITSLQPGKLKDTFDFLPPMNVPGVGSTRAKDFPKAFARVKTEAQIARESLFHKGKAEPLEKAAAVIRKRGEKYINFEEFWKKRALDKPTATLAQEPGTTSSIVNAIGAGSSKIVTTTTKASPGVALIQRDTKAPSKIPFKESKPSTSITSKISKASITSKIKTSSVVSRITKITKSPSKTLSSKTASRSVKSLSPSPRSLSPSRSLTSKVSITSPTSPTSPGSKSPASPLSPSSPGSPTGRSGGQAVSSLVSVASAKPLLIPVESAKRILPPILWDSQTPDPKPRPKKPRADFIGNVSEVRISEGIKKKYDIKYGRIRTAKISRKDIVQSGMGIFVKAPKKRTIPERKIDHVLSQSPKKGKQPTLLISHVNQKIRL